MSKEKKALTADEVFDWDANTLQKPFPVEYRGKVFMVRELDSSAVADISKSCIRESGERDEKEFRARLIQAGCVSPSFGPGHITRIKTLNSTLHAILWTSIVNGPKKKDE